MESFSLMHFNWEKAGNKRIFRTKVKKNMSFEILSHVVLM